MSFGSLGKYRFIALACAAAFATPVHADWAQSTSLDAVKPAPDAYALQPQNPPSITWSRHPKATATTTYTLELRRGSSPPVTYTTNRNWFLPETKLEDGTYTWRVLASNSIEWSTPRTFVINATSSEFLVPSNATLRERAIGRGRPRMLPSTFIQYAQWTPAMVAERGAAVKVLTQDVVRRFTLPPLRDANWPLTPTTATTAAYVAQTAEIRNKVSIMTYQLESAALLYRLVPEQRYLDEAIRRGDELASLSPSGPTSFVNQDQGTRMIALSLAKAADLLWGKVDNTRRVRWLESVRLRGLDMYADLAGNNGRLDQFPYDSHGGNNLGFLAVISALMLNDFPEARTWFDFSTRAYIHSVFAWSGPEGGYSQGSAYGQHTTDPALKMWDTLSLLTGVNLYDKPWSKGFARFFGHFVPPGQPVHLFGDGHEEKPYTPFLKAYASRVATPEAKWYYNSLAGAEEPLTLLLAPSPLPVNQVATANAPPNAGVYPSIGWVAMHSDLWKAQRTSLYFKSSPYGGYSHSHADQNGIVLLRNNAVLLSETGYYDYYGSPLWSSWYRQTKAHNAITFDGGVGQATDGNTLNLRRKGKITAFSTTAAVDYAEGDATAAYDGQLTGALRKLWYLRGKDQIVVLDKLSSATARRFEWNFHAVVPITKNADNSSTIVNGTESLCIRPLTTNAVYATRTGAAPKAGTYEAHAAYTLPSATSAEFLMLLDIGCKNPAVSLRDTANGRTLTVSGQTIVLPK